MEVPDKAGIGVRGLGEPLGSHFVHGERWYVQKNPTSLRNIFLGHPVVIVFL